MSAERGVSQDELLAWIEEAGDPAVIADIGRRLALDPELEAWAAGARADRAGVILLGEAHAREAPRGMWREALAEAERRALLLEHEIEPERGPFRLRITPLRMGIAAAVLIVVSIGTIAPLIAPPSGSAGLAAAPQGEPARSDAEAFTLTPTLTQGDKTLAGRSLADSVELARGQAVPEPRATLASFADGWAADPNGLVAGRAMAGLSFGNTEMLAPRLRAMPGAFPESWGMSHERARRLAQDNRLVVRVRTDDVDGYIERLQGAMGRRATLESAGLASDVNGVAAPASLALRAPAGKLERALRLCAINAADIALSEAPATGRPGAWAEAALWWAGGSGEGGVRLYVEPASDD